MKFRLGLVGHRDTLAMVSDLVEEYFDEVKVYPEEFGNDDIISDATERIAKLQTNCDGILYSRRDPYMLISARLHHTVPVRYVDIDNSHLLISLLKANINYEIKPTNISIDTIDPASVTEALGTVGIARDQLTIHMVTTESVENGLVNATLAQHLEHYQKGARLCVTNVSDVYRSLLEKDIPATLISPTAESFIHEIRNLMLRYKLKVQDSGTLAVIQINLRYKEQFRFYGDMPIREIDELSTASKLMVDFAEKLDGAMFCLNRWQYLIFCNRLLLENATDNFTEISLMKEINANTVFDICLGIGCGQTVKDAQSNATLAANHITHRGTSTMVALSPEQIIGPIRPKNKHHAVVSITESRLREIARTTGLSANTINTLYQAIHRRNTNLFTSAELAEILEVTRRTVNRSVERLLDHQYAMIAGKNLASAKGRPARVIRLMF